MREANTALLLSYGMILIRMKILSHKAVPYVHLLMCFLSCGNQPGIFIDNLEAEGEGGLMGGSLPLLCLERPGRNSSSMEES